MTALELNEVEVILDIEPLGPRRMGTLYRQRARGAEIYSFEFDNDWLASGDAIALDPDLLPAPGRTYPPADRTQFGVFMDSAPDRWGRTLMQRREARAGRRAEAASTHSYGVGISPRRPRFLSTRSLAISSRRKFTVPGQLCRERCAATNLPSRTDRAPREL
jgi:hypothetical protein